MVRLSGGRYTERQLRQNVWRQGSTWKERKKVGWIEESWKVER
jgi:hypothetical protein